MELGADDIGEVVVATAVGVDELAFLFGKLLESRSALSLNCPMECYTPVDIRARVNSRISHPPQHRREILECNKTPQGIRNVGVQAGTAVQQETPEGALGVQICEIELAPEPVGWQEEIQAHHQASRASDAMNLSKCGLQVGEVAQAIAHKNAIERPIREW